MANELIILLSGGVANTIPADSLGGVKSTTQLGSEGVIWDSAAIPGVALLDGWGNGEGTGTLTYVDVDATLSWTPPGGVEGEPLQVGGLDPGESVTLTSYNNESGRVAKVLTVGITETALPAADQTEDVVIARQMNNLFGDVTEAMAITGAVRYRGLYLESSSLLPKNVVAVLQSNSPASDILSIGWDDPGTMQTVADEETAPTGILFANESLGVISLPAGESRGIWVRDIVPAGSVIGADPVRAVLRFNAT